MFSLIRTFARENMKRTSWWLLTAAILISMSARADNITFADANVKALCVTNWDTDHDEQLSIEEAAAVTSLGTVFREKTNITTFNELRYFTGLTSINSYAFYKSTIERVTFPTTVTAIGEDAFRGSSIGPTLTIPGTVKTIGNYAFNDCQSLTRITLQEGVESVGWHTFSGPIAYLSLPSTLKNMSSMAVDPYVNANPDSGIFIPKGDLWVYSYNKAPSNISSQAFYYVFGKSHLIVPFGTIDIYNSTTGWTRFGEYFELGDVNRDKVLDDTDLAALIIYVEGTTPETFYEDMGDINGDGVVDEKDIKLLRDYLYPPTYQLGDVNGDGAVNVLDVTTLVSYVLNESLETFVEAAADVNGDGNINTLDVTKLVSIILQSSN